MENDNNLTNWNPSSFWSSHSMMDQSDPFESALSSMVSSPVASHADRGDFMITQVIGRLGSFSSFGSHELSLSEAEQLEYGSMVKAETGELSRASSFKSMRSQMGCVGKSVEGFENGELGDSREGSSVSEQIPNASNQSKKRKGGPKGKAKEASFSASVKNGKDVTDENQNCKRSKTDEASGNGKKGQKSNKESNDKTSKDSSAVVEPPKDYIHVRARRGQATDSHSLAERVRREKISERMKFLQDLVPGCNKVTGKAVMLDEIINYVQSLQHQVEFLSMKLATVNPRMDLHMEALLSKEILQSQGALQNALYQLDSAASASFPFGYQPHQLPPLHSNNISNETDTHFPVNLNASSLIQNPTMQSPAFDRFGGAHSQFLEDDLQSMLQMGFGQIEQHGLHGSVASAQMKIEH